MHWKRWSVRWIVFIRADWQSSLRGRMGDCKPQPCAKRWIDNLECTAWPEKFPIRRLMIWLRTSADPMEDVYGRSCGNATERERLHLPSCRRENLILDSIR